MSNVVVLLSAFTHDDVKFNKNMDFGHPMLKQVLWNRNFENLSLFFMSVTHICLRRKQLLDNCCSSDIKHDIPTF